MGRPSSYTAELVATHAAELLRVADGTLYWRVDRRVGRGMGRIHARAGDEAGCVAATGYRVVRIDGRLYLAHRLVWLITTGKWPAEIDHINRNRADNRPENLREVTSAENKANTGLSNRNTSGRKGVSWNKTLSKWQATAVIDGRSRYLGLYSDIDQASLAYQAATEHKHAA